MTNINQSIHILPLVMAISVPPQPHHYKIPCTLSILQTRLIFQVRAHYCGANYLATLK